MGLLRHHPSIGKLRCEGYDWRFSRRELDALIWGEGRSLRPGGAAGRRRSRAIRDRGIVRQVELSSYVRPFRPVTDDALDQMSTCNHASVLRNATNLSPRISSGKGSQSGDGSPRFAKRATNIAAALCPSPCRGRRGK